MRIVAGVGSQGLSSSIVAGLTELGRSACCAMAVWICGCSTIEPGPNFQVPDETFNADFFYCHVEPEFIFALKCGPGDPSQGDNGSCHFSSAVSGMRLADHPQVDCGGGDHPVNGQSGVGMTGTGSNAAGNLEEVSLEMNRDYLTAPLFVRPSSDTAHGMTSPTNHPRAIFDRGNSQVQQLLSTWAAK